MLGSSTAQRHAHPHVLHFIPGQNPVNARKLRSSRPVTRRLTYCNREGLLVTRAQNSAAMRAPTGVDLPSLYDPNNRQQQLGPRGVETFFVNKQGLKIASYFWPSEAPKNTKAVVLAVHGHGAHIQNEYLRRQVRCVLLLCRIQLSSPMPADHQDSGHACDLGAWQAQDLPGLLGPVFQRGGVLRVWHRPAGPRLL